MIKVPAVLLLQYAVLVRVVSLAMPSYRIPSGGLCWVTPAKRTCWLPQVASKTGGSTSWFLSAIVKRFGKGSARWDVTHTHSVTITAIYGLKCRYIHRCLWKLLGVAQCWDQGFDGSLLMTLLRQSPLIDWHKPRKTHTYNYFQEEGQCLHSW